jgi:hypothetical protein
MGLLHLPLLLKEMVCPKKKGIAPPTTFDDGNTMEEYNKSMWKMTCGTKLRLTCGAKLRTITSSFL